MMGPKNDIELSKLLPKHDIYLTASLEEAGANHVLEAIAAGLPIVYRKGGGSINEYCKNFGIEYENNIESLMAAINEAKNNYSVLKNNIEKYNDCIEVNINKYLEIICSI